MNTENNNKLLAEFLGRNGKVKKSLYTWKGIDDLLTGGWTEVKYMKFHSDWNWIMQVVEKIESFIFDDDMYYNFQILGGCYVTIIDSKTNEFGSYSSSTRLLTVYQACIDFVKWYNAQKN
jgi:hypothetical protein